MADLGAEVVEQEVVFDEDPVTPWIKLVGGYLQRTFAGVRHTDAWEQVTPGLREQMEGSEGLTVVDFVKAADAAHTLNLRLVDLFAHSRLLVTPTVAGQTPLCGGLGTIDGAEVQNWVGFTYPFNMTGSPAGTVCVGRTQAGLPVGLQLIGPQHGDVGVLRAMAALEARSGSTTAPTPGRCWTDRAFCVGGGWGGGRGGCLGLARGVGWGGGRGGWGGPGPRGRLARRRAAGAGLARRAGSAGGEELLEQLDVVGDHPVHGEMAFDGRPACTPGRSRRGGRWPRPSSDSSSTRNPSRPSR